MNQQNHYKSLITLKSLHEKSISILPQKTLGFHDDVVCLPKFIYFHYEVISIFAQI